MQKIILNDFSLSEKKMKTKFFFSGVLDIPELNNLEHYLFTKNKYKEEIRLHFEDFDVIDQLTMILLEYILLNYISKSKSKVKIKFSLPASQKFRSPAIFGSFLSEYYDDRYIEVDKEYFQKKYELDKQMLTEGFINYRLHHNCESDIDIREHLMNKFVELLIEIEDEPRKKIIKLASELVDNSKFHVESDCIIDVFHYKLIIEDGKEVIATEMIVLNFATKFLYTNIQEIYENDKLVSKLDNDNIMKKHALQYRKIKSGLYETNYTKEQYLIKSLFDKHVSSRYNIDKLNLVGTQSGRGLNDILRHIVKESIDSIGQVYVLSGNDALFIEESDDGENNLTFKPVPSAYRLNGTGFKLRFLSEGDDVL